MRSIKIKVKYILIFVLLVLISFSFIVPISLLSYGKMIQDKDLDKAKQAYKSVITFNPFNNLGKDAALYNLASIILPDDIQRNTHTIYNAGMSRNGQYINYEMVDRAEKYLKEIIDKHENSKFYFDAYKKLFHLNIMCGRLDNANDLTMKGLKSDNSKIRDISLRFSMLLSFVGKDYEEALNIGNELIKENKADYDTHILMGDVYYLKNKLNQASKYYNEAKKLSKNGLISSSERWTLETDKDSYSSLRLIDKAKNLFSGNGRIKGKVEVNGKAVPFAYIYLKDDDFHSTGHESETLFTITDSNGNYEFNNLSPKTYSLGIGIYSIYLTDSVYQSPKNSYIFLKNGETINYDFNFVPPIKVLNPLELYETAENTVNLSWDNVKDAESYSISVVVFVNPNKLEGSNIRFVIEQDIKETNHTLDLDKINSGLHGFMTDQEGRTNPQTYLGPFYPGATVPVIVEAFDKNNNKLTSSVPINVKYSNLSIIKVSDKNIKNSDKLLLDGNIEKAVLEYENDLKTNPNDTHSLLVLSKIYSAGTKIKHDNSGKEISEGRNPERAFELATKLYNIKGDIVYQRNVLRRLSTNSEINKKWLFEKYKDMDDKSLEYVDYISMGNLNLKLGNFKDADENFSKVYTMIKDKNYFDMRPVLLELYNKDYKTALKYLNKVDLSFYKFDRNTFQKDITTIDTFSKNHEEYRKFEEALRLVLSMENSLSIKEKYQRAYESVNHSSYKNILKQVGDYYYLFHIE